jgi:hypothetical protein
VKTYESMEEAEAHLIRQQEEHSGRRGRNHVEESRQDNEALDFFGARVQRREEEK